MRMLTLIAALVLAAPLAGCAGGWRNGPPPGADGAVTPAGGGGGAAAATTAGSADGVTFTYEGAAQTVHLAGEFNGWSTTADPLTRNAQGVWTITKDLAPGRYTYKFVIDGTNWKEDPNAAESVDDGYGGKNSVVVVGAAAKPAAAPAAKKTAPAATGGGVTFTYEGAAQTVHLAGEFNGWNTTADPLAKNAQGVWTITKQLEPGRYPYKFVIDGSTWKEDPSAAESVDDGYGGKNSVVVVGEAAGAAAKPAAAPAKAGAAGSGKAPLIDPEGVRFFFAGSYRTVHLAGDFNGWSTTADPLQVGEDGLWTIQKKLEPGVYTYKFVVDGTTWKQDPANPESVDDGFGGTNSVITVK